MLNLSVTIFSENLFYFYLVLSACYSCFSSMFDSTGRVYHDFQEYKIFRESPCLFTYRFTERWMKGRNGAGARAIAPQKLLLHVRRN